MKKQVIVATALAVLSGATMGVGAAWAAVIPVTSTIQTGVQDSTGNGEGDASAGPYVGDYENSADTLNYLQRTIVTFELPDLPAGETIQSVEFKIYYNGPQGTPAGNAVLYHLPNENGTTTVDPSAYEATPAELIADSLATPSSESGYLPAIKSADFHALLTAIQSDYENDSGQKVATFRIEIPDLKFPSGSNGNGIYDRYLFNGPATKHPTTLAITTVPEPAASGMLVAMGGLLLGGRRRAPSRK